MSQLNARLLALGLALSGGWLAGCGAPAPVQGPLPMPAVATRVTHYAGDLFSGARPWKAGDLKAADASSVRVAFVVLDRPLAMEGEAVGSAARLVLERRGGAALLPSTRLQRNARILATGDPEKALEIVKTSQGGRGTLVDVLYGALPPGVTAVFSARRRGESDPSMPLGVSVLVHRPAGADAGKAFEIALMVEAFAREDDAADAGEGQGKAPALLNFEREAAVLDRPHGAEGDAFSLETPFPQAGAPDGVLLAVFKTGPAPADAGEEADLHARAFARAVGDIEGASAAPVKVIGPASGVHGWAGLADALSSLRAGERERAALVYLSNQTGAELCEEAALVADDGTLSSIAKAVALSARDGGLPPEREPVAWTLERACIGVLGGLLAEQKLAPELAAVLAAHAGAVGRDPSSLEDVLRSSKSRTDLARRLVEENQIFLEDNSPAARARAFDWLQEMGEAPEGYDPLAPLKERRAALEKAQAAKEGATPAEAAK